MRADACARTSASAPGPGSGQSPPIVTPSAPATGPSGTGSFFALVSLAAAAELATALALSPAAGLLPLVAPLRGRDHGSMRCQPSLRGNRVLHRISKEVVF